MTGPTEETLDALEARIAALPAGHNRLLVAIAGPPAAGKSTLAAALVARLNRNSRRAAAIPMDGFHLDNSVLIERGLLPRKGAPETFDAAGFIHMIRRLSTEDEVIIPIFDRDRDIAVAGAHCVDVNTGIAVVEGNYLLLNEPPWTELPPLWDLSIYIDVPMAELERRMIQRWIDYDMTPGDAEARARSNDIPNAVRISAGSKAADITIEPGPGRTN